MGLMEAFALGRTGVEDVTPTQYTRIFQGVHALVNVDAEERGYRSGHQVYLHHAMYGDHFKVEFVAENVDTGSDALVPLEHLDQEGVITFIVLHSQ